MFKSPAWHFYGLKPYNMRDIIIIGAGLTGLSLAYELEKKGLDFQVLEARERVGGRILTNYASQGASIELGATWLGKKHGALAALLTELGLTTHEQYMGPSAIYESISTSPPQLAQLPPNPDPSLRISGGSSALIQQLVSTFDESRRSLNTVVEQIHYQEGMVSVQTNQGVFSARTVVSTLPPRLLLEKVMLIPTLPEKVGKIAADTHTWMGESIKVGLRYAEPFWRKPNSSGTIFSNVGPVTEMYDHSDEAGNNYALKGFLNSSFHAATSDYRRDLLLKQLERYYGPRVHDFLDYEECVWSQEAFTYVPYEAYILPHQNNGHEAFRQAFWEGHFFLAGSETAAQYPGYMDGAVRSARWVLSQLDAQVEAGAST